MILWVALRKQGNVAFQQKEYHRAIEFYTQAMKINTQNQHVSLETAY